MELAYLSQWIIIFLCTTIGTCRLYNAIESGCLVEKGASIRKMGILMYVIIKLSNKTLIHSRKPHYFLSTC